MFQNILSSIENVGLLPSITFLFFFGFFIVMLFFVLRMDKKSVKKMSEIPLDEPHSMNP